MPSPTSDQPLLTWVRLFDGRLWHVLGQHPRTLCDMVAVDGNPERTPEYTEDAVPANAWVCTRCVEHLHEMAAAARQAWLHDPRRTFRDPLPAPDPDRPPEAESRANTIPADVTSPASEREA